ncbi:MAG: OmpH family outer membrane protein [Blastocatellia bacterium]|nr:OmpH family outer membrane protein [Blastocatellia bacterium]
MKKLILLPAICSLLALAAIAQTPTPPPKTTSATSSAPAAGSAPSGGTGVEGKVAYLNVAQFTQGIAELKVKIDALYSEFAPKDKELQSEEEALNNLKSKISNQGGTVSPQTRQQWQDELAQKDREFKRKTEDYGAAGQKKLNDVSAPIYNKISDFLKKYCQQRGIVLVLDGGRAYEAGVLIWGTQAADITKDFMDEYNKANPAGTTATK